MGSRALEVRSRALDTNANIAAPKAIVLGVIAHLLEREQQEVWWQQSQILGKTFTPDNTVDTLRSCTELSAKVLGTV